MVENRPYLTLLSHLIVLVGIAITILPIWITFVASTHPIEAIMDGTVPMWPGGKLIENYTTVLGAGIEDAGGIPVGVMLMNSLIMALSITIGKIAISLIAAYAIVYFNFPFRMSCFWIIFVTLMLPVEVRILPTFKVVADLNLLNRDGDLPVPPVLPDGAGGTGRGSPHRRSRTLAVLQGHSSAPLADQYRGLVRDPLHLRLEPVSLAAAGHHRGKFLHRGHGHSAHGSGGGIPAAVESGHGDDDAGDDPARDRGGGDAEAVRAGPGGNREVTISQGA
jgi:hypothetical protein